jgi:preprotein translocase subunit Sss1
MKKRTEKTDAEIVKILTKVQKPKYEEYKKERQKEMQERMRERQ